MHASDLHAYRYRVWSTAQPRSARANARVHDKVVRCSPSMSEVPRLNTAQACKEATLDQRVRALEAEQSRRLAAEAALAASIQALSLRLGAVEQAVTKLARASSVDPAGPILAELSEMRLQVCASQEEAARSASGAERALRSTQEALASTAELNAMYQRLGMLRESVATLQGRKADRDQVDAEFEELREHMGEQVPSWPPHEPVGCRHRLSTHGRHVCRAPYPLAVTS